MSADTARLQRLLGHDDLRWIVQRSRYRLERGLALQGPIVLQDATPAQRRAVERLLGRPVAPGQSVTVRLESVQVTLRRAGAAPDLRSAIEALTGPVPDRSAARLATNRAWATAFAPLEALSAERPVLEAWLAGVRSTGLLRRLARAEAAAGLRLAESAAGVLEQLPCSGVPLSVLANAVTGDGHSLDAGRPLCSLVIRAAGQLGGVPDGDGAEWRRTVWASVGVLCGELTSPVLCMNLPGDPATVSGQALAVWAHVGQPTYLTVRQLLRDAPRFHSLRGRAVYVCENPTVVAEAANVLGASGAPLVCASGHPAGAATLLLRSLAESGALLRYHGDFDWPGLGIANGIFARFRACPWRFDAAAYRASAHSAGSALRGHRVEASWDPELSDAMVAVGRKIEEEQVLGALLADLSALP
jgi:uncharacterized protein (TIGR02679 family)